MAAGFQYVSKLPPANDFPGVGKSDSTPLFAGPPNC